MLGRRPVVMIARLAPVAGDLRRLRDDLRPILAHRGSPKPIRDSLYMPRCSTHALCIPRPVSFWQQETRELSFRTEASEWITAYPGTNRPVALSLR
jgi:hypothetical protein